MLHRLRNIVVLALLITSAAANRGKPTCGECPGRMAGCLQNCEGALLCKNRCECLLSQSDEFCREKCNYGCKPI